MSLIIIIFFIFYPFYFYDADGAIDIDGILGENFRDHIYAV